MRALLTTTSLVLALAAAACGSSSNSSDGQYGNQVDVNDPTALKGATDVEGSVPVGSSTTIGYVHKPEYTQVPYLAVTLTAASTPDTQTGDQQITVTGKFPGTPEVYVVDPSFALIESKSNLVTNADGTTTNTVTVPRSTIDRTILVHDPMWSSPMNFEIAVGM